MNENFVSIAVDAPEETAPLTSEAVRTLSEEEAAFWAADGYAWEDGGGEGPAADQPKSLSLRGNDSFTLKYMDEEKTVSREEVVTLAQKGMDYDRVRRRLDETGGALKDYEAMKGKLGLRGAQLEWMDALAREQGRDLDEILENAHVELLTGKTGRSREECLGDARRQREEWQQRDGARRRRSEEIDAFFRAYPEQARDPGKIPGSVWKRVQQGESLLDAYRSHEVEQLRRELARQKEELQKQQDRVRTTGSQHTRGSKWEDPFLALWYNGE